MSPKRDAVLRELAWLTDESPEWARPDADEGWRPFHVRWFRRRDALTAQAGLSIGQVEHHLRKLAKDGLAVRLQRRRGGEVGYFVTDAGRAALA